MAQALVRVRWLTILLLVLVPAPLLKGEEAQTTSSNNEIAPRKDGDELDSVASKKIHHVVNLKVNVDTQLVVNVKLSNDKNTILHAEKKLIGTEGQAEVLVEQEEGFDSMDETQTRDRLALQKFWYSVGTNKLMKDGLWMGNKHVCEWSGITCGPLPGHGEIPGKSVSKIELPHHGLSGKLPTELGMMDYLVEISMENNTIIGPIPTELARIPYLRSLGFVNNAMTGSIPDELTEIALEGLDIAGNRFGGTIPLDNSLVWTNSIAYLDLRGNSFSGSIPADVSMYTRLRYFVAGKNLLTGTVPASIFKLTLLKILDLGDNEFEGTIPHGISKLKNLQFLDLYNNDFEGEFDFEEVWALNGLRELRLSENRFTGRLPPSLDNLGWVDMWQLEHLDLNDNKFDGKLPPELFHGLKATLSWLGIRNNSFSGEIPTEIGLLSRLTTFNAARNYLTGSIPSTMLNLNPNLRLNFTGNQLTGDIPTTFCGEGFEHTSLLYKTFGCAALLCPPGTFHHHGHATLHSGCRSCPGDSSRFLGTMQCENRTILKGDVDGDGMLSDRETLRLIHIDLIGSMWGEQYQDWSDTEKDKCSLEGVTCDSSDRIVKVDLTNANVCSNGGQNAGPTEFCAGLPTELGLLTSLRTLNLSRRPFLGGSLPSEVGKLTELNSIDLSSCPSMTGTIPTEIGNLSRLETFTFTGSIPSELFRLSKLEHIGLTNNELTGTLPEDMNLPVMREFLISRNYLDGTIPTQVGSFSSLSNFEAYGNYFKGSIPSETANLSELKRLDLFNCMLDGPLPERYSTSLQILNLKDNHLTGTIPEHLGMLDDIFWVDVSDNSLHGTIPASLGASSTLKDLRLGNNMLYDPIPDELCKNPIINNGGAKTYGCDGILCPLCYTNEYGFATPNRPCVPCPDEQCTLYRGSTKCRRFSDEDYLTLIYELMNGKENWPEEIRENWGNKDISICEWAGIGCDDDGTATSIKIPLMGSTNPSK